MPALDEISDIGCCNRKHTHTYIDIERGRGTPKEREKKRSDISKKDLMGKVVNVSLLVISASDKIL